MLKKLAMEPTRINSSPANLLDVVTLLNNYKTEKRPHTELATRPKRANEAEESFRRTQVVVFQSHPSVPGQIRVPKRDRFEPAGEGFGGADVAGERRAKWAEERHRLREVEGGGGLREMGGMGFVGRCFPVYPMDSGKLGGSSALFVLVWVTLSRPPLQLE